jgi:hypothetical protein
VKRLAIFAVAVGVIVGAGQSALADEAGRGDPENDVWEYTFGLGGSYGGWSTDIAGVRVQHLARRIVVTTTFHDLGKWSDFDVYVDSHAGPAVDYRFHVGGGGAGALYRGWTSERVCAIQKRIDRSTGVIVVAAPRRCYGRPHAIRVKAQFVEKWRRYPTVDCCYSSATDDTRWTPKARRD